MDFLFLLILAIGLSFDTFAVSISCGLVVRKITFWNASRIALSLALFQGLLPLIGWFFGNELRPLLADYDHWIAFGLLTILGIKMIMESLSADKEERKFDPLKFWVMIYLSLATSIDALVVGFGFAMLQVHIFWAIAIIGGVTFLVAMLGMLIGKQTGNKFGKRMEIVGGLILILIGIKILVSHSGLI
jgi:putative Mn2+ efflux pump MntP